MRKNFPQKNTRKILPAENEMKNKKYNLNLNGDTENALGIIPENETDADSRKKEKTEKKAYIKAEKARKLSEKQALREEKKQNRREFSEWKAQQKALRAEAGRKENEKKTEAGNYGKIKAEKDGKVKVKAKKKTSDGMTEEQILRAELKRIASKQSTDAEWINLDNAALIFPAAENADKSNMFRISVVLKKKVDPLTLQEALNETVPRFPSITSAVKRGLFWYYLEPSNRPLVVEKQTDFPMRKIPLDARHALIRVTYFNCEVSVEFFHAATDGTGAVTYVNSLMYCYFRLLKEKEAALAETPQPKNDGITELTEKEKFSENENDEREAALAEKDGNGKRPRTENAENGGIKGFSENENLTGNGDGDVANALNGEKSEGNGAFGNSTLAENKGNCTFSENEGKLSLEGNCTLGENGKIGFSEKDGGAEAARFGTRDSESDEPQDMTNCLDTRDRPRPEELTDSFQTCFDHKKKGENKAVRAYYYKCARLPGTALILTKGIVDADELNRCAAAKNATVTEFMTAALIWAINEDRVTLGKDLKKPVVISVPVNLRRLYPSKTLRNFVSMMAIRHETERDFDAILDSVKKQFAEQNTTDFFDKLVGFNVNAQHNPVIKIMPLFIKNAALSFCSRNYGDKSRTLSFSNLGKVKAPESFREHIVRYEFSLGPMIREGIDIACAAFNGVCVMTFSKTTKDSAIERKFFGKLSESGVTVAVETNYEY